MPKQAGMRKGFYLQIHVIFRADKVTKVIISVGPSAPVPGSSSEGPG